MATHDSENARTDLEPLTPMEAARLWKESRLDELAQATLEVQGYHIDQFTEWLIDEGIEDMRDITARTVHRFRLSISGDVQQNTLAQRIGTVKRFLRFCASIDGVDPDVVERIELPPREGQPRTETIETETAEEALSFLRKYAYASREHVLLALCWHTAIRTGTLRALDVSDVETANNRLRIRHRPSSDTPLKNGEEAERYIALDADLTEVVRDYIQEKRPNVEDEYGREPLFCTENGRAAVKTLRRWFQTVTRPCIYSDGCPHERDPSECDAAQRSRDASDCPSSVSGHPVRRGSITHHLRNDVPEKVVSDRCNVSQDVLDEHYDRRTEDEKMEQRRKFINDI